MKLSAEQEKVVEAGQGLVVVQSGAGTGKTTVLTRRICHLIDHGMSPATISAFTFTRDAAQEMRGRLQAILPGQAASVTLSTLHACAARVVREHAAAGGLKAGFAIADEGTLQPLLLEAASEQRLLQMVGDTQEEREALMEIRGSFSTWQENGLDLEEAEALVAGGSHGDVDIRHVMAYISFQKAKRARGLLDFGDLTMAACRVLSDPVIRAVVSRRHAWVMIDEAQDLNRVQIRFLRLLTSAYNNIMLVGDDDQSLYSFRGAVPRLMERVEEFFPEAAAKACERHVLSINRRCTEQVLIPANKVVSYNPREGAKILTSGRDGAPVRALGFTTERMMTKSVAEQIAALQAQGVAMGDIAVLARTSSALNGLEGCFVSEGVPYVMHTGERFASRPEVTDIFHYLALAQRPDFRESLCAIVNRPSRRIGAAAIAIVEDLMDRTGCSASIALRRAAEEKLVRSGGTRMVELAEQLDTLSAAYEGGSPARAVLEFIYGPMGYRAWMTGQRSAPRTVKHSLQAMMRMAGDDLEVGEFLAELTTMRNTEFPMDGAVYVGTLHGSKGKEWRHVFLVGVERDILPHRRAMKNGRSSKSLASLSPWDVSDRSNVEEERRLFHVGLTRAKDTCTLCFASVRGYGETQRRTHPSSFLYEAGLKVPAVKLPLAMKQR